MTITDRIKSFDDALKASGITDQETLSLLKYDGIVKYMRGAKALAQLNIIVDVLNEGWIPDWANSSEYKYYIWWNISGVGVSYDGYGNAATHTDVGARLVFKNRELAEYAAKQFEGIWKEFLKVA